MIAIGMIIVAALFAIYYFLQIGGSAYKSADNAILFVLGVMISLAGLIAAVLT